MTRLKPLHLVLPCLLCLLPVQSEAQHAGRSDSTLPALNGARPGDRVTSTRPQRDASEAAFRQELLRQAELDRLFNPGLGNGGYGPPVFPSIILPPGAASTPCSGRDCLRPQPLPMRPR